MVAPTVAGGGDENCDDYYGLDEHLLFHDIDEDRHKDYYGYEYDHGYGDADG